ncbi:IS1634 family transposase [Actinotignum timonense]|uniref:IS1634 family transposase n=6 Tax=Bacillati TaxID=1783272 RepID=A0ABU5GF37_9ACTO|nr:IS1634 family transposase [Actinotignum timonense]MDY5147252.1 IS1634 family transposase [Actinotignum timonense]
MAPFLRKVRTASGATAVQIVEKQGRVNRVIKHLGSAHDEATLAALLEKGRQELSPGQLKLDLFDSGSPGSPRASTLAKRSTLLWQVLQDAYRVVGFDQAIRDNVFEQLVLARIVEPASKADTIRILDELGVEHASLRTIFTTLRRCADKDYRSQLARACFGHATKSGDLSLVLYDVTTLYFEAEREDEDGDANEGLRKVGYSKERRVDPQIVVGLLVDRGGFPLEIGCFEGNKAETKTILPVVKGFQARHGLDSFVVVADAGMLSANNLKELDAAGFRFIVGARQTKAPYDLESHFHWHGASFTDGQIIDTVTPRHANTKVNDKLKEDEPVWDETMVKSWRAIWQYSARRARRDGLTLEAQRRRAMEAIEGFKPARKPRFVKTTRNGCSFDEVAFERARRLEGLKGYVTNIPIAVAPATQIVDSYHELWHVEQSFRMSKSDLRARPIFHRKREAIEAHLTVVMAALAISRYLYQETGVTTKKLVRLLRPIQEQTILYQGHEIRSSDPIPPQAQEILDSLGH